MTNELTNDEYLKQCDDDILSIVILHSLDYSELLKLDTAVFPIDFEVWSETQRTLNIISSQSYTNAIPKSIIHEIDIFLKHLLNLPSDKWTHTEFESNPFWKNSRKKAKDLVSKLNLEGKNYWDI